MPMGGGMPGMKGMLPARAEWACAEVGAAAAGDNYAEVGAAAAGDTYADHEAIRMSWARVVVWGGSGVAGRQAEAARLEAFRFRWEGMGCSGTRPRGTKHQPGGGMKGGKPGGGGKPMGGAPGNGGPCEA